MLVPKKWIVVTVMILIIIGISIFQTSSSENDGQPVIVEESSPEVESAEKVSEVSKPLLVVDIKGSVHDPGVYEMSEGDRVVDAIEYAGGLTSEADEHQINLAELVYDEMIIMIPEVSDSQNSTDLSIDSRQQDGKIRINQASAEELTLLSGIGEKKAQTIIDYREENGAFKSVDELLNISGIGEKTLEQIEEDLIVP
ncbi:helix-hairpin-helix domain-containing protein [Alkalibacillus sp. S2W]|uniref:helix-hairpin-helix domain-containing protein n=1 Tax=Alkalibacillus sp. S2W TaxID=3386553 RepID=UPI00398D217C